MPTIKSALLKVAARCNLNCDYCYVFNHIDQSWKSLPAKMSEEVIRNFAERLSNYINKTKLDEFLCIFHGGEPLLIGAETIVHYKKLIENIVFSQTMRKVTLYFSLQTNGVLLKESNLELFEKENIGISMSLDGPKKVQDLHRLSHSGQSSYSKAKRGLDLLKKHRSIFEGVIAVIDPRTDPRDVLSFFNEHSPPACDFLLPDANYQKKPFFKNTVPTCYTDWLTRCFDIWIDEFPHLKVRFFEQLCKAILSGVSNTEAFGFGDISLLSIETDGSYHDTDIFKTTEEGYSNLNLTVQNNEFLEALSSTKIQEHRKYLQKEGLSKICKDCSVVEICGGGCLQHRYDAKNGFINPSIYCEELFTIINHAYNRLQDLIERDAQDLIYDNSEKKFSEKEFKNYNDTIYKEIYPAKIFDHWVEICKNSFETTFGKLILKQSSLRKLKAFYNALSMGEQIRFVTYPSTILWVTLSRRLLDQTPSYNLEGNKLVSFDPCTTLERNIKLIKKENTYFLIHDNDYLLRCLFDGLVFFENDQLVIQEAINLTKKALKLIEEYSPNVYREMKLFSPAIQFIRDPTAHPEKLVSFSDNHVPGCLYVSIRQKGKFASVEDIADSILHEYRHQKLYLLENYTPVILKNSPYIKSPWREEPRPVSGVFHGLFVFYELTKFWVWIFENKKSKSSLQTIDQNIKMMSDAVDTLKGCKLSKTGDYFLQSVDKYIDKVNATIVFKEREKKCVKVV